MGIPMERKKMIIIDIIKIIIDVIIISMLIIVIGCKIKKLKDYGRLF